jgi:hypothetical protein
MVHSLPAGQSSEVAHSTQVSCTHFLSRDPVHCESSRHSAQAPWVVSHTSDDAQSRSVVQGKAHEWLTPLHVELACWTQSAIPMHSTHVCSVGSQRVASREVQSESERQPTESPS